MQPTGYWKQTCFLATSFQWLNVLFLLAELELTCESACNVRLFPLDRSFLLDTGQVVPFSTLKTKIKLKYTKWRTLAASGVPLIHKTQQDPAASSNSFQRAMDTVKYINSYCRQLRSLARCVWTSTIFNMYRSEHYRIPRRLPCLESDFINHQISWYQGMFRQTHTSLLHRALQF